MGKSSAEEPNVAEQEPLNISLTLPPYPSLADLTTAIGSDICVLKQRREEIADGLRTLATVVGKPASDIPAVPGLLNDIVRLHSWATGVGKRERDALRRLARAALERAGLAQVPGRYGEPLSPRWRSLLETVESPSQRLALSPLCRFASRRGILPSAVDDRVFDELLTALQEDSLLKDVLNTHRLACRSWNRAVDAVPGWPKRKVTVPEYRDTYEVPWSAFPATLKAELDRYLHKGSRAAPPADADYRPWSRATSDNVGKLLHSYISAAVRGGSQPVSLRTLSDIVTCGAVRNALGFLLTRSNGKISVQTGKMAGAVASMARNWVGVDEAQQAELDGLRKRVTPPKGGLSSEHRKLLRQFDTPANVSAILGLPRRVIAAMEAGNAGEAAKARLVQTALLVELLSVAAIRVGELARLDVSDVPLGRGQVRARLRFKRSGKGTPVAVDIVLPESTRGLLRTYLRKHRPVLAGAGCTAMFPGRAGKAKTDQILRRQVSEAVLEFTGLTMTPNLFRHFAAKHFLDSHPGEFGVVRFALGHRSVQTTCDKYSEMDGPAAFRAADKVVLGAGGNPPRRRGRHGCDGRPAAV